MNTSANSLVIRTRNIEKSTRTPEFTAGLLGIWEASVRASHHFLTEEDIRSLRPQAEEAIRQIETLWAVDCDDVRIGCMGIQSGKIENPAAVKFYEKMGFRTFRRDSTDDQGNPFPILRMKRLS